MSFDNPGILGLLPVLVILIVFIVIRYHKGRKMVALFAMAAPSSERQSMLRELRLRMIFSDVFFLLFTGFLIIAMAGPRWGLRIVTDHRRGLDLILAFDLSRSMNAADCGAGEDRITRLNRGVEIAMDLASSLGDVRIGAAIGKDKGILAVPLTYDTEVIFGFLNSLDSRTITGRGTNLESLIDAAAASFQDSIPSRRGIILFSDGEALSGSFQGAVERIRRAGIALSAVGLGSDEGGPVPLTAADDPTDSQPFLLTDEGAPVISSRQTAVLRYGAGRTGGIYIDGSRKDAAFALSAYINSISTESRLSGYRREAKPRWHIFILAAMAALCGSRLMGFRRRWYSRRYAHTAGSVKSSVFILLCVFLLNSCAKVQGKLLIMEANFFSTRGFYTEAISSYMKALDYEAPYAEYGLGTAYFALEEGSAALERYKAAIKSLDELRPEQHTELRYRLYYNMGIIHFEKGNYEEAAGAFRDALKVDGSRIEAKRNLELSLLTITRNNPPQAASSQGRVEGSQQGLAGNSSALFEYLKEKEQEHWKSREWTEESDFSGPDY